VKHLTSFLAMVLAVVLIACGGGSNGGNDGNDSTAGEAQGAYFGTAQIGSTMLTFVGIILPNDKVYALYGEEFDGVLNVYGMVSGQGRSDHGSYAASITDYYYINDYQHSTGTLSVTYGTGTLTGRITESNATFTISATTSDLSNFNYSTPASLTSATGTWEGWLFANMSLPIEVAPDGSFVGSVPEASGLDCNFTGSLTPSNSKNYFAVAMNLQGASCPYGKVTGAAVVVSEGTTSQLIVAVNSAEFGTVFIGNKQDPL
jgi:hypothetical protein